MLTRRTILAGSAAALSMRSAWADDANTRYLGAARTGAGDFQLCGLSSVGDITFRIPIPARGHAAAAHPIRAEAVAFARRPGLFGLLIECATGKILKRLQAPAGRHFYGHGAFTADGSLLLTTENAFETGEGRIGLWSVEEGYQRIGDVASGGIGPHEIIRLPDDGFAVANGGIRTHPDTGREKLNLETMRPNLTYLGPTLEITNVVDVDEALHQNSIRHLAVNDSGTVAIAMQWQGDLFEAPPLLALHDRRSPMVYCAADIGLQRNMNGYAGSVAFSGDGDLVCITSPRGDAIQLFNSAGEFLHQKTVFDVCGLARSTTGLVATSGTGKVVTVRDDELIDTADSDVAWDNHLVPV